MDDKIHIGDFVRYNPGFPSAKPDVGEVVDVATPTDGWVTVRWPDGATCWCVAAALEKVPTAALP